MCSAEYGCNLCVCVVPCVLVAGRELSMCVDGLLQLFLFGSSAVAKLFHNRKSGQCAFLLETSHTFMPSDSFRTKRKQHISVIVAREPHMRLLTVLFSMKLVRNSSISVRPSRKFSAVFSDSSSAWWAATFNRACRALRLQL